MRSCIVLLAVQNILDFRIVDVTVSIVLYFPSVALFIYYLEGEYVIFSHFTSFKGLGSFERQGACSFILVDEDKVVNVNAFLIGYSLYVEFAVSKIRYGYGDLVLSGVYCDTLSIFRCLLSIVDELFTVILMRIVECREADSSVFTALYSIYNILVFIVEGELELLTFLKRSSV